MFSFLWKVPDTAEVDSIFSEAFACLEQGLCYDEINDYNNTLEMYERGLNLIREGEKHKRAKKSELYKSLMEAKPSVEHRINVMKKEGPKPNNEKRAIEEDAKSLDEKEAIRSQLDSYGYQEADLIYYLPEGVQLFTIDGDKTTAPTEPTSMQILRYTPANHDDQSFEDVQEPRVFIQVGPWVYPLMKDKTPILKNEVGAYILPNPTPDSPNMLVAILLSSDIEDRIVEELHIVLREYADLKIEETTTQELTSDEKSRLSRKISQFIISSAEKIAWGVETTTVKVVTRVEDNGEKYRATLDANGKPIRVSPLVKGSVVYMHKGSKTVAKCTRYLLDKVGDMGISMGRKLAESAQNTFGGGKTGGLVSGTIEILGGGITGISTVWLSLENGSKTLCRSIANQTVQNVRIKYGDEASETTHHALFAAGHGSLAAMQLWDLGPRSVAGRMARRAGIQIVRDLQTNKLEMAVPITEKKKL